MIFRSHNFGSIFAVKLRGSEIVKNPKTKKFVSLAAASVREVGILLSVFGPMDAFYQMQAMPEGAEVVRTFGVTIAILGVILALSGIFIESVGEEI